MRSRTSELVALGVTLVVIWVCPAGLLAEESRTVPEATHIERSHPALTQVEQSKRWGLTVEDWQRYERLMHGPRGIWSPHLDPVTALGVHAESDAERRRYAEILVRLERERTEREFAFERMVQQVKRELYPNDLPFDPAKLEELLVQARTREPPFRAGDRLLLFVNLECADCNRLTQHLVGEVQSLPGLLLDVYAVGPVRDEDIQAWAQKLKLPQALVSLKAGSPLTKTRPRSIASPAIPHSPCRCSFEAGARRMRCCPTNPMFNLRVGAYLLRERWQAAGNLWPTCETLDLLCELSHRGRKRHAHRLYDLPAGPFDFAA